MTRIARGWSLAKQSWAVLRADRSLMLFPVIAFVATVAAALLLFGPGLALYYGSGHKSVFLIVAGVLAVYALSFISVFFNVALAAAVKQSLGGKDTTLDDGLRVARANVRAIAGWALVAGTVGLALQAVQNAAGDNVIARILSSLVDVAWSAATFFVIPVIALEGVGPREAFSRSVAVLRARWGEGVVGSAAIGLAVFLVALVPSIALLAGGLALQPSAGGAAAGLFVLAGLVVAAAVLVSTTLNAIFRVALYEYATAGGPPALMSAPENPFAESDLAAAFAPKRRRGLFGR